MPVLEADHFDLSDDSGQNELGRRLSACCYMRSTI
jgi:hypothetical protein